MSPLPAGRPKLVVRRFLPNSFYWLYFVSSVSLAGRTMHRCCRGHGKQNPSAPVSAPHSSERNHFMLRGLHRSLLRKRWANSPTPWNVAPISRNRASNRSPARSTKVRPPRSTSRGVPGEVKNLKSSAHEPASRPVSLTVVRWI
jgi:hypothetical protein